MSDEDRLTDERIAEMREAFEPACQCDMAAGEECERCAAWQTLCELVVRDRVRRADVQRILTCVYCGHQYPPGTPPSNHDALTKHIAECPRHPLAKANRRIKELEDACETAYAYVLNDSPLSARRTLALVFLGRHRRAEGGE